ncbi:MAG TPA: hypothetical protein VLS89_06640, partial [Candidatus Nanopelagicales bacterium]|nr:hypothetical protein [Candidatus Nanopelagicales bacterium]
MDKDSKYEQDGGKVVGTMYEMNCPTVIHGIVGVEALVSISPQVEAGTPKLQCVGEPKFGRVPGAAAAPGKCSFIVHQQFSLKIPLTISAVAQAKPGNTLCEVPG